MDPDEIKLMNAVNEAEVRKEARQILWRGVAISCLCAPIGWAIGWWIGDLIKALIR